MRNELVEFKDELPLEVSVEEICECLYTLTSYGKELYSYFVGRKNDVINIKIVYSLSGNNTIDRNTAIDDICVKISDYILTLSNAKCITFGQPPLEMIIELYQPMLKKMVDKLSVQWKQFEYDDLFSIGNYILIKLYRQGYYINKYLVWTSLNNEILVQYRNIKYKPITVSLDDAIKLDVKIDSEELTYGDIIKDESYEEEEEEKQDEKDLEKYVFEQVKEIIIEKIGQRGWDQLWRDYGKGHTTNTTQASMRRIKAYFKELGLTRQDFINNYRR